MKCARRLLGQDTSISYSQTKCAHKSFALWRRLRPSSKQRRLAKSLWGVVLAALTHRSRFANFTPVMGKAFDIACLSLRRMRPRSRRWICPWCSASTAPAEERPPPKCWPGLTCKRNTPVSSWLLRVTARVRAGSIPPFEQAGVGRSCQNCSKHWTPSSRIWQLIPRAFT